MRLYHSSWSRRLGVVAIVGLLIAPAQAKKLDDQRRDYTAGLEAVRLGQAKRAQELIVRTRDYILAPYLEYEFLRDRIAQTSPDVLADFIERAKDAPVGDMLRKKWLRHLVRRGQWDLFERHFRANDDWDLRCIKLDRTLRTGAEPASLDKEIDALWLSGSPRPNECEPVFKKLHAEGYLTPARVWARVALAMEARNLSIAKAMGNYLPAEERPWISRWISLHREPLAALRAWDDPVETEVARAALKHGVMRLGHRDAQIAMDEWRDLKARYSFSEADDSEIKRYLGLLAAQDHHPAALEWLTDVTPAAGDDNLREWRVRAAIRAADFKLVKFFVEAMSDAQKAEPAWRYWRARALEAMGQEQAAKRELRELARTRTYYGFLAADRLQLPYSLEHSAVQPSPEEVSEMLARPGVQMAKELLAIGDTVNARRQWQWTTQALDNRGLQVAAAIAGAWGWHDRAILTLTRTDNMDDIELRFPLLHRQMVETNAEANGIAPAWMYGIMRQESAFVVDARSGAGALGLMQLMPGTGREVGRLLRLPVRNNDAILRIDNNLRLGARYLQTVLKQFQGHIALATAAYNAGPTRVREWLPKGTPMEAERWVETIPYTETRRYVKNVLAFTAVYERRLGGEGTRLSDGMPPVPAAATD